MSAGVDSPHGRLIGQAGTVQGRVLEVHRSPYHVAVVDRGNPHPIAVLNTEQAHELSDALVRAADR